MKRRSFLQRSTACAAVIGFSRQAWGAEKAYARHFPAEVVRAPKLPIPEHQREPFGWRTNTISNSENPSLVLAWKDLSLDVRPTHFRIAIGLDERDEKTAEFYLPKSGRRLGLLELRFATQFQIYEMPLTAEDIADIRREGIALRLTKGSSLEVFTSGTTIPAALLPHLLVPGTASPMDEYFARMNSFACVQQFGWMEGCVLDGLLDLGELPEHVEMQKTAKQHIDLFCKDSKLVYENHISAPSDGTLYGIEGCLPFAALARTNPNSPVVDLALKFWSSHRRASGSIQDGVHMSSEGTYTVAYPMALIAKARSSDTLMDDALYQCRIRQARLFDGVEFWRTYNDDGKRGNRNWARGIAWQILGLTRTLLVAKERSDIDDLVISLQRFAAWTIQWQRDDGLWSVFVDEPSLTADTAGSAGIGAALALGARQGWLNQTARIAAQSTLVGLESHLTPDGFLTGVSQSNKGGEALQRGNYRTIYQMGMGLMGQLVAALA